MDIPTDLVTYAVTSAAGLLGYNTLRLERIASKLNKHIEDEGRNDLNMSSRLRKVERKLPNGEVQAMYNMMKTLLKSNGTATQAMEDEWKKVDEAIRQEEQEGVEYDDI